MGNRFVEPHPPRQPSVQMPLPEWRPPAVVSKGRHSLRQRRGERKKQVALGNFEVLRLLPVALCPNSHVGTSKYPRSRLDLGPRVEGASPSSAGSTSLSSYRKPSLPATPFAGFQGAEPLVVVSKGTRKSLWPGPGAGGPGNATATLGYAIYQRGFQNFQMGYASSIAWVMFALIMALTALQFWLQRKWVHYDN